MESMDFTSVRRARSISLLGTSALCLALLLAGCGVSDAGAKPGGKVPAADAPAGSAGGGCTTTDADYALFSDPAMSVHPKDGSVFGDGSTFTFQFDKHDETRAPTYGYDLSYIQDSGSASPMGGAFFDQDETGGFTTSNKVFDSAADGRHGFMTVSVTQDPTIDGTALDAKTTVLGRYCVLFKVSD